MDIFQKASEAKKAIATIEDCIENLKGSNFYNIFGSEEERKKDISKFEKQLILAKAKYKETLTEIINEYEKL